MAIRKVARMGNPVLRKKNRELTEAEIKSPAIQELIKDMVETMHEYAGVGLAAPQIHESLKLAVIQVKSDNKRYAGEEGSDLLVIINPKIKILDQKKLGFWEGCLSVPGLRGFVERPRKIKVSYLNEKAEAKDIIVDDFLAIVFQHELDHLEGILYIDKLTDSKKLVFNDEFDKFYTDEESVD
ncbi:MAG: peptide deformylase [Bacteriovoracaceae bacterium]|nr:peptide deformylase [Bacteriovoracaceae bacterium]